MMQYNLRLNEKTKQRAQTLARREGVSENLLYQIAIEEFLAKKESSEFMSKLMKRVITPQEKKSILLKLRKNKKEVLFPEDKE